MVEWRIIARAPQYEVNELGDIRHRDTLRVRKPCVDGGPRRGYLRITVKANDKWLHLDIHRVVAEAFLGAPPTPRHEVAHLDGNRQNPRLDNLAWKTPKENKADIRVHGTGNQRRGEAHPRAKLTYAKVTEARQLEVEGLSQRKIAAKLGVSLGAIQRALAGVTWGTTVQP
jgi:hypothetical protein